MAEQLQVGVIGLGRVAWMLELDPLEQHPCTHVGAWIGRDDIRLVAGCDIDVEKRSAFSAAYPAVKLYMDYREMLANERLDCVSICAYATEREAMITAAAEAGVKGIWAEKALACSLAEIDRINKSVKKYNVSLMVSYMRRWGADYRTVCELLSSGAIGRLQSVTAQFSGNLLHTGTHAFDVLNLFCGEPQHVTGALEHVNVLVEDSGYKYSSNKIETQLVDAGGSALIDFKGNVKGFIQGLARNYFWFEFELQGTKGMIRIGNEQYELWQRAPSQRHTGFHELTRVQNFAREEGNVWIDACADLVHAVRLGGRTRCGVNEAWIALATALAIHTSDKEDGRKVLLSDIDPELYVASR